MKYYIIAGEASGDLHGSNLMKELKLQDANADFRVWGGDLMQNQGGYLVRHYRDLAFMGFIEVVKNLRYILKNLDFCKKDIVAYRPHVLILIDYPGFNLRIAQFAKSIGFRVYYYISPQIWAWKQSRVNIIKQNVDHMFVILPFEKKFYQKFDYFVDFVGHPLLDALPETNLTLKTDRKTIALLPGSRKQEINTMLPIMLQAAIKCVGFDVVVAAAPSIDISFYTSIIGNDSVKIISGKTYQILENASVALVTSGTATLETALLNTPQVVCYKGNRFSYLIARQVIKVKYISLVNLILDKPAVKELIQTDLNAENLHKELLKLLEPNFQQEMLANYNELRNLLGNKGASKRTAQLMWKYLNKKNIDETWQIDSEKLV